MTKPRWQKLKDLGDNARVWDISTGKKYVMGQLEPLHQEGCSGKVEDFGVISTRSLTPEGRYEYGEIVYGGFLRVEGDGRRCSLAG